MSVLLGLIGRLVVLWTPGNIYANESQRKAGVGNIVNRNIATDSAERAVLNATGWRYLAEEPILRPYGGAIIPILGVRRNREARGKVWGR